jgi:hypothetical protein
LRAFGCANDALNLVRISASDAEKDDMAVHDRMINITTMAKNGGGLGARVSLAKRAPISICAARWRWFSGDQKRVGIKPFDNIYDDDLFFLFFFCFCVCLFLVNIVAQKGEMAVIKDSGKQILENN